MAWGKIYLYDRLLRVTVDFFFKVSVTALEVASFVASLDVFQLLSSLFILVDMCYAAFDKLVKGQ